MNALVAARMRYIPVGPGADWRDLPNMVVRLSDGNYSKKLLVSAYSWVCLLLVIIIGYTPIMTRRMVMVRRRHCVECVHVQSLNLVTWLTGSTIHSSLGVYHILVCYSVCVCVYWCDVCVCVCKGNRHNHWAGLYGRLEWDGFFSTTVTNPEPMGKQVSITSPSSNSISYNIGCIG